MAGEKTEKATPKRLRDERKKGNVFKSQEINTVAGLLVVFILLSNLGGLIINALTKNIAYFWKLASVSGNTTVDTKTVFIDSIAAYLVAALPTLLAAGLTAVIVTLAQTKGLVTFEAAKPKFNKLNPLNGIKRMFSLKGVVELLKSLLKVIILGYIVFDTYRKHWSEFPSLMDVDFKQTIVYLANFVYDMVINCCMVFIVLAAADYMYQRWSYEKKLRMSKQEIKEEYKQTEGDPQIKGQIRARQREMASRRMMAEVPTADVIIRNPTHYAVAIKYKAEKNRAPAVVAKGADLLALRIIKAAEENNVIVMENKPLARGLYDAVPLEREIPEEFYQPVAEVLAFVYSTKKKGFRASNKKDGRQ